MGKTVLIIVPQLGFDPTEVAVPWKTLTAAGITCVFTSPAGGAARCDQVMIDGVGLYLLKWSMRADANGRAAYAELLASGALDATQPYDEALGTDEATLARYDGLLLPGGHCPDMKPYLEDGRVHRFIQRFHGTQKPLAAVCHGVVVAARAGVLKGLRVTALPSWMETLAHTLTRAWMGNYYKTYSGTSVQQEVTESSILNFESGPKNLTRDDAKWEATGAGFCVQDGSVLTARWPGDTHRFGALFVRMLEEQR